MHLNSPCLPFLRRSSLRVALALGVGCTAAKPAPMDTDIAVGDTDASSDTDSDVPVDTDTDLPPDTDVDADDTDTGVRGDTDADTDGLPDTGTQDTDSPRDTAPTDSGGDSAETGRYLHIGGKLVDAGLDVNDPLIRCGAGGGVAAPVVFPATTVWADHGYARWVRAGAAPSDYQPEQAAGAPDVYPGSGDSVNAWASSNSTRDSHLRVTWDTPVSAATLVVVETQAPQPIAIVDFHLTDGTRWRHQVQWRRDNACSFIASWAVPHRRRVTEVTLMIAGSANSGWEEIDAVGLIPRSADSGDTGGL